MFRLSIDPGLAVPVYKQAAQAIKVEILSGRLKDGDQLPPIRELAKVIKLHPNTVAKVYALLEEEGFVESKVGSGNWVKYKNKELDHLRKMLVEEEFRNFLDRVIALGAAKKDIKVLVEKYLNGEEK
jgi:GntR family transcriptional regulator